MAKKMIFSGITAVIMITALAGAFPAGAAAPDNYEYGLMHPSGDMLAQWAAHNQTVPELALPATRTADPLPASFSLLDRLNYIPAERDQGQIGSCWVWSGTGIMEVALDVQNQAHERLSEQYLVSTYNNGTGLNWAGNGGNLSDLVNFYNGTGRAIPWANTNASYQDGQIPDQEETIVPAASIALEPHYQVNSMVEVDIPFRGLDEATVINNIKAALYSNKALWWAFYMAEREDWIIFFDYWNTQTESAIWDPGYAAGETWTSGGAGHAVLCVGYEDPEGTANDRWIMLNSWGVTAGRPSGLFSIPMHMDYDATFHDAVNEYHSYEWKTLNVEYGVVAPTVDNASGTSGETGTAARLNGRIVCGGGENPESVIYWGAVNGGTDPLRWQHAINLGVTPMGVISADVTGLDESTLYYYRCAASNTAGTAWAPGASLFGFLAGDANADGAINALDITKIERIIVALDTPGPTADANGDGAINALDITKVERIIANLPG